MVRTEYWFRINAYLRKTLGLSKNKARSAAWKLQEMARDLATFDNPTFEDFKEQMIIGMTLPAYNSENPNEGMKQDGN